MQGAQILGNEAYREVRCSDLPCYIFSLFDVTVFKQFLDPISLDMAAFNVTGQGMKRNAALRLYSGS